MTGGVEGGGNGNTDGSPYSQYLSQVEHDHPDFRRTLAENPDVHPLDIEKALDDFGPVVLEHGYPTRSERPHFGERQVRDPDQIEVGGYYWLCCVTGERGFIQITQSPQEVNLSSGSSHIIKCEGTGLGGRAKDRISLADVGVLPYIKSDGEIIWHGWHWLERAEPVDEVEIRFQEEPIVVSVRNSVPLKDLLVEIDVDPNLPRDVMVYFCCEEITGTPIGGAFRRPEEFVTDGAVFGGSRDGYSLYIKGASYLYFRATEEGEDCHFVQTCDKLTNIRKIAKGAGANSLVFSGQRWS